MYQLKTRYSFEVWVFLYFIISYKNAPFECVIVFYGYIESLFVFI